MPTQSAADRSLVAKIAAAERWGRTSDRAAATAPARAGLRDKFAREIDPGGTLTPAELERRVDQLMHALMMKMSRRASESRRKARESTKAAVAAEAELDGLGGDTDAA
jgi:hypothetical protein